MKRILALAMVLMIMLGGAAACSSSGGSTQAGATASQTASGTAAQSASASAATCASAGTRKIPKTRLLADLALTYGAFHRYLYKPYQAGTFQKGASGRTAAIIKAGLATAAIVKLLSNAAQNAAADPTLCKYVPNIDTIKSSLSSLGGAIRGGTATAGAVNGTSGLFDQLKNATGFTVPSNDSLPGLG